MELLSSIGWMDGRGALYTHAGSSFLFLFLPSTLLGYGSEVGLGAICNFNGVVISATYERRPVSVVAFVHLLSFALEIMNRGRFE